VPDVKLSFFVEQRPLDIFLKNEGFIFPVKVFLLAIYFSSDLLDILQHHYPVPSVAVLAGLKNPNIL
jgi:hypothetical protein